MRVAIIPARGGSKRIPRKNIKPFCGKPIIGWSISAAIESNCFDRIIVSTDDSEIADVAKSYGAEVPFMRPTELSGDFTGTMAVIQHALEWLQKHEHNAFPDYVCCIYATAPFVNATDLRRGLNVLLESGSDYAFSVAHYPSPIQRALRINKNGRVEMFTPEYFESRSQDLEEAYYDAGQFYWSVSQAWLKKQPIFGPDSAPIVLPSYRVQDIDTSEDWARAEYLFQAIQAGAG